MGKIIAILNFKGGCAKTTTTINLASALNILGKKVLVVDLDVQCNTSDNLGFKPGMGNTASELLTQKLEKMPIYNYRTNFDYIPSNQGMEFVPMELNKKNRREYVLKRILSLAVPSYDYILIDCPAGKGILNTNAMTAADELIIPIICEPYDIKGFKMMFQYINSIKEDEVNPDLKIGGILITKYESRLSQHKSFAFDMRHMFKGMIYNTMIRKNAELPKAAGQFKTVFETAPTCNGAEDYMQLAREITGIKKKKDVKK